MRVVFMGTPPFAVAILEALLGSTHQVVGVVTAPDRPAGRGKKLKPSAVKVRAQEQQLPLLQPEKLRDPLFNKALQEWGAELFVVVAFRMLPQMVWSLPPRGTINLHASLLPQYRGAAPINWAIINGESESGVTTFFINEHIDEGAVLLQQRVAIAPHDTAGDLHDKLMQAGAPLVVQTLDLLEEDRLQAQPQPSAGDTLHGAPKLFKDDLKLSARESALKLWRKIKGLSPYPAAYFEAMPDEGDSPVPIKVLLARPAEGIVQRAAGTVEVAKPNTIVLHTKDGALRLEQLQWPGKKRMSAQEVLNGQLINAQWRFW